MGSLQTSLSSVRPPLSAPKLYPSAKRERPGRIDSFTPELANAGQKTTSRSVSDEWVLVQRAIAGDSASQNKLFAAHTARLYRTAFAMLRNKEDAEDAVQDGLGSAYTKLRSFQGRSSFSTRITRIVINSALMSRRRRSTRREASLQEILDNRAEQLAHRIADRRPGPEEICSATEINGLVEEQIRRLPAEIQRTFRLREMEGLSATESNRALGIRGNTLKSRIHRARRKIKDALQRSLVAPVIAFRRGS